MSTEQHVTVINGVEHLSLDAIGMLCGITSEEAAAEYALQQEVRPGRFLIPPSWIRGCKELQAKYGTRNADELLACIKAEAGAA